MRGIVFHFRTTLTRLGFVLGLALCSFVQVGHAGEDLVKYEDLEHGFSVSFPKEWQVKKGGPGATAALAGSGMREKPDDSYAETVAVEVHSAAPGQTAADALTKVLEQLGAKKPELADLPLEGHSYKAAALPLDLKSAKGSVGLNATYLALIENGNTYIISCYSEREQVEKYKDVFSRVISSLKYFPPTQTQPKPLTNPNEPFTLEDKVRGFSITFPPHWTITPTPADAGGTLAVSASGPRDGPNDPFSETVTVQVLPLEPGQSAQDILTLALAKTDKKIAEFYKVTIAGREFTAIGAEIEQPGSGLKLQLSSVVLLAGKRAYYINCISELDQKEKFRDTFNAILNSLKFQD